MKTKSIDDSDKIEKLGGIIDTKNYSKNIRRHNALLLSVLKYSMLKIMDFYEFTFKNKKECEFQTRKILNPIRGY